MAARYATIVPSTGRDRDAQGRAHAMLSYGCVAIHGATAEGFGADVFDKSARRDRPTG
jgi:hypothetical protein